MLSRVPPSTALDEQAKVAAKRMTFDTIANSTCLDTVARLTALDHHRLVAYLTKREKEASRLINEPLWTIFYARCACKTQTKTKFQEEIRKAVLDAFVSNPPLAMERSVALACKQFPTVLPEARGM